MPLASQQIAVVTGAAGFVGTALTAQLLAKGYEVRGTVRDPSNRQKVAHLEALGAALPGKLTLHAADLLSEGSFDEVTKGATLVFHTASPFLTSHEDAVRDLVDPAVKGTQNVLRSAGRHKATVRRVILTSSFASIIKPKSGPSQGGIYTTDDWNTDSTVEDGAYRYSKVTAEKAAWALAKEQGLDLVTICPTFVLGPVLSTRTDAVSIQTFKAFLEGENKDMVGWMVDVRDVATAHVLAAEVASASGRFILSNTHTTPTEAVSEALRAAFPDLAFPPGKPGERKRVIDNSRTEKELGLRLKPLHETFVDMARTLFALGLAKPQTKS